MAKDKLVWRAERRLVRELKCWAKNPRKITPEKFTQLMERIKSRGFHDVLKIDTDDTILSGNQRKRALVQLGIKEVTVLVPNRKLANEERNKIGLESNTNDGEWDFESLKSFDVDLLTDIGFSDADLSNIWNEPETEENFDVEKELKKITKPKTKLGDIIEMGAHRLICGDSTDPMVLARLFGNERASMIYSDPVYNLKGGISYSKGVGGKGNYGGNVNDTRTDAEYREFLKKSMLNALSVAKHDVHVFYWCDQIYIGMIQDLYREVGIENKRVCLWLKNSHNPTPGVAFNKCYEPCPYGVRGKPYIAKNIQNLNEVLNKEITTGNSMYDEASDMLDVWVAKRLPVMDYTHATSKPPKLHEKAIRRCTRPGAIILDSFSGSASTMVTAEQLKRRVFAVELEPAFCDLAIRRYEKLTGRKATIIRRHEKE